jgi:hypothetical protein
MVRASGNNENPFLRNSNPMSQLSKSLDTSLEGRSHRAITRGIAGVLLILLAFAPPVVAKGDGSSMLAVAESIVNHRSIAVPPDLGIVGRDGRFYSPWYPLLSLILVPFVTVGEGLARAFHLPSHYVAGSAALISSSLIITANALLTIALALRLGASLDGAMWASLAFVFGTVALVDAREILADPLLALLTAGTLYVSLGESDTASTHASVALAGLSVLAKPPGILVGPAVGIYALVRKRGFVATIAPLIGTSIGLVSYLGYNYFRFGNPFLFGQPLDFSVKNIPLGLLGQILSPGHGLLWYCPAVFALAWLPKSVFHRVEVWLVIGVAAAYLLLYSAWRTWDAGWSWGPRFLIAGLPGVMALTGLLIPRGRQWLIAFTIAGVVVATPTLVSIYQRVYVDSATAGVNDSVRDWSVQKAPITAAWSSAYKTICDSTLPQNDVSHLIREAGAGYHRTSDEMPSLRIVALWWWMLPAVHIPAWIGALVAFVMLTSGIVLIASALRTAER